MSFQINNFVVPVKTNIHFTGILSIFLAIFLLQSAIVSATSPSGDGIRKNQKTGTLTHPVWIFFDRRDTSEKAYDAVLSGLDTKARDRRARARGHIVNVSDLPPHPDDLLALRENGVKIRTISKWLSAVSVEGTDAQIKSISSLQHVKEVRPVAIGKRTDPDFETSTSRSISEIDTSIYGYSWDQNNLIGAPEAHDMGYTGDGVRIGFLDSGFRHFYDHIALQYTNVVGAWNAHDSTDDVYGHTHGTLVISVTTAQDTGYMIGIAPDVEVLLVRTEDADSEYVMEEDFWVAGLEWAEANGADLISTSLGYYGWYLPEDFDGNTAITTIASDLAAERGLLVITSAGNLGQDGINAPADGDSTLAVGATRANGEYVSFSSVGPTADGRIKPDVAAMGHHVWVPNDTTIDEYIDGSGTSFSCPTVAGAAAILLQADPELLPMDIINIFKTTSSQSNNPDTLLGWGIINIPSALNYLLNVGSNRTIIPGNFELRGIYPNPTNSEARIMFELANNGTVKVVLSDILGRQVISNSYYLKSGAHNLPLKLAALPSGTYPLRIESNGELRYNKLVLIK
ncbi:MAG: S8/S53 family peptidase [Candidatus Electryonea clarkiae]|nr:S8/S53 family peptidase [Candidatus Electryonea clarkiae]